MIGVRRRSTTRLWHLVVTVMACGPWVGAARAQAPENLSLARMYGAGVHAYFAGDFARSYDDLTAAVEAESADPRVLYFRGLAALRLGRLDEAEADFSEAARLESNALGAWPVSNALERVQGSDRIRLERHRVRARVAVVQSDRAKERGRYSGIDARQPEVLRGMQPDTLPAPGAGGANPFVDSPERGAVAPESKELPGDGGATDEPGAGAADQKADDAGELDPGAGDAGAADAGADEVGSPDAGAGGAAEPPMAEEGETVVEPEASAEPAAETEPAEAAGEDPFGDKAPQPADPADPPAEDVPAPAEGQ